MGGGDARVDLDMVPDAFLCAVLSVVVVVVGGGYTLHY